MLKSDHGGYPEWVRGGNDSRPVRRSRGQNGKTMKALEIESRRQEARVDGRGTHVFDDKKDDTG